MTYRHTIGDPDVVAAIEAVKADLKSRIAKAIKTMKRNGTTACSLMCLMQNVSTKGLAMSTMEYRSWAADLAREAAKEAKFKILGEASYGEWK